MKKFTALLVFAGIAAMQTTTLFAKGHICPGESVLRSVASTQKTSIKFVNNSKSAEESFILYWLDFEGKRIKYGQIFPGDTIEQSTFLGHPWVITSPVPGGGEDCIDLYLPRRNGDTIALGGDTSQPMEEEYFPRPAGSWGGKVRSGPGMNFTAIASLAEGEGVTLTENTGILMNGYPWYRIRFREDGRGYQWGGILCELDKPSPGLFQTCQ